jgi:hypothetical protein
VRRELRDLVVVAIAAATARVVGAALVHSLGFEAVSDDDFARVVIAQRFAASPKLDPTGTSWLPLPFWIVGSAMRVLGSTLEVARALAVTSAAISGAFVACVATLAGIPWKRAVAAALVAAAMPWGMQLAVATVPEVPAACLAAAGALAAASSSGRLRLVGAFALLGSTWSRYDAWPVALAFAALCLFDAARDRRERAWLVASSLVALAGPVLWSTWQHFVYGDAFRYLRLVRSYRRALGAGPSLLQRVIGYPFGVVEELREVLFAGIIGAICAMIADRRRLAGDARARFGIDPRRPLALALLQLVLLIAGDVRDGAPTHHPERALLGPATVLLFVSADAVGAFLATSKRRLAWSAFATVVLVSWIALRLHRSLGFYANAPRAREIAAGHALARSIDRDVRVLVDTRDLEGIDYGYYALLAAFGRPIDAEVDRDQDPRKPKVASSLEDPMRLRARLAETHARAILAWGDLRRRNAEAIGGRVVAEENAGSAQKWAVIVVPADVFSPGPP